MNSNQCNSHLVSSIQIRNAQNIKKSGMLFKIFQLFWNLATNLDSFSKRWRLTHLVLVPSLTSSYIICTVCTMPPGVGCSPCMGIFCWQYSIPHQHSCTGHLLAVVWNRFPIHEDRTEGEVNAFRRLFCKKHFVICKWDDVLKELCMLKETNENQCWMKFAQHDRNWFRIRLQIQEYPHNLIVYFEIYAFDLNTCPKFSLLWETELT